MKARRTTLGLFWKRRRRLWQRSYNGRGEDVGKALRNASLSQSEKLREHHSAC